ncbi:Fumarate reductase [Balamuthia mandrillaris]
MLKSAQDAFGLASSSSPASTAVTPRKVIILGGGLAGMSAAIEAHRAGAHVVLMEKEARLGGNSAKASSGINAVLTPAQQETHSNDSIETFTQDTIKSGGGMSDPVLVDVLVHSSPAAIEFLESFGLELRALSKCGGHSEARTHRSKATPEGDIKNVGWEITSTLRKYLESLPTERLTILTSSKVTRLLLDEHNRVTGVAYTTSNQQDEKQAMADAVILATGGYGADREGLLERFAPQARHLATTNGGWATGDGMKLAQQIGAELIQMDQVQIHPTAFVDPKDPTNPTKFLAPEALRASGGILINQQGKRFTNELGYRNVVTEAIFKHCEEAQVNEEEKQKGRPVPKVSYMILNDAAVDLFQAAALSFYKSKGFIPEVQGVSELAKHLNVDEQVLKQTLLDYSAAKQKGVDEFGKTTFPVDFSLDDHFHVLTITPAIHYTMGGCRVDPQTHVLNASGQPIPGLYGAGEVTGGLHGHNRLAGNSLLDCVVFGRIAGQQAAKGELH